MTQARRRHTPNFWSRLDTPLKVISSFLGIATILTGAAFAVFGNPFSEDPRDVEALTNPGAIGSYQIRRCQQRHGLEKPRAIEGDIGARVRKFKRCEWPPTTATQPDGYSEIESRFEFMPQRSAADEFDTVETVEASCEELTLEFGLVHMGGRRFKSVRLRPGRLLVVTSRPSPKGDFPVIKSRFLDSTPQYINLPGPSAGVFHALHTSHIDLLDAHCAT
jgi:hypothetical protein